MIRNKDKKIIEAVLNIDDKRFFKLVADGCLNESVMKNTNFFYSPPLPIYYITICWDFVLKDYYEWKQEYRDIVYKRKCQNDKIKEFFITQYRVDMSDLPFSNYCDYFFSQPQDATVEDCLWEAKDKLISQGFKEIDIDLYCSVVKFDYKQVEHLLQCGANPRTWIPCEGEDQCMDRIGAECSFLEIELDHMIMGKSYEKKMDPYIQHLIGLAEAIEAICLYCLSSFQLQSYKKSFTLKKNAKEIYVVNTI